MTYCLCTNLQHRYRCQRCYPVADVPAAQFKDDLQTPFLLQTGVIRPANHRGLPHPAAVTRDIHWQVRRPQRLLKRTILLQVRQVNIIDLNMC